MSTFIKIDINEREKDHISIYLSFSTDESRPFTIDAMLSNGNNDGKNLNKENSEKQRGTFADKINHSDNLHNGYRLDRLIKPIDLSTTGTDTSSPTNEQAPSISSSSSSSASSSASASASASTSVLPNTAAALNFFHMKNMIELTVESARLREKQLENEIGTLTSLRI